MATFSEALEYLKDNKKVLRKTFNGYAVIFKYKDKLRKMNKNKETYSYVPTNEDLLADDWFIVHEKEKPFEYLEEVEYKGEKYNFINYASDEMCMIVNENYKYDFIDYLSDNACMIINKNEIIIVKLNELKRF